MIHYFLSWYQGAIWGNLLASVVWAAPVFLYTHHHFGKLHNRLDKLNKELRK